MGQLDQNRISFRRASVIPTCDVHGAVRHTPSRQFLVDQLAVVVAIAHLERAGIPPCPTIISEMIGIDLGAVKAAVQQLAAAETPIASLLCHRTLPTEKAGND